MSGGELPLKNDKYINEEFEITPSNKAIEEILPKDIYKLWYDDFAKS